MSIFILDYGIGNVGALLSMYRRLGHPAELLSAPCELVSGDRLILPGIGAFDAGVRALRQHGLAEFVRKVAEDGFPLLGICLGMQLLCTRSEEGSEAGLDLIPIDIRRFEQSNDIRIPHMGWNVVTPVRPNPLLPEDEQDEQRFYFTHSFRAPADAGDYVIAVTDHGAPFASAIGRGNVFGVQFHPEKSHRFGKALLDRFARWNPVMNKHA